MSCPYPGHVLFVATSPDMILLLTYWMCLVDLNNKYNFFRALLPERWLTLNNVVGWILCEIASEIQRVAFRKFIWEFVWAGEGELRCFSKLHLN